MSPAEVTRIRNPPRTDAQHQLGAAFLLPTSKSSAQHLKDLSDRNEKKYKQIVHSVQEELTLGVW